MPEQVAKVALQRADGLEILRCARVAVTNPREAWKLSRKPVGDADGARQARRRRELETDDARPRVAVDACLRDAGVAGVALIAEAKN